MARMIPPVVAADAPKGERQLFARLREDPAARAWIIFHSFDIRRHVARGEGEADMVIVVPELGVLCIEVKGCGVTREGGLWTYSYDPPRTSPVGPFRQASQASHSIRQYLGGKDTSLSRLVYHSAVLFTEIDFADKALEWEPWQIIGRTEFLRHPISFLVCRILEAAHAQCRNRHPAPVWYGKHSYPTSRQSETILRLMRPDFEYVANGRNDVELAESAIRRFTEEQFDAIDHLEDNRRVLFKGPAGTGKTFLAIEALRRAIRQGQGAALFCFNNLLAAWLRRETRGIVEEAAARGLSVFVGTLAAFMRSISGAEVPALAGKEFWNTTLPALATDALLADDSKAPVFDLLIVDEAQDLLSDASLDVFELLLEGGLGGGRWAMFGDFERQAIYDDPEAPMGLVRLQGRTGQGVVSTYRLRINCRNTTRIAEAVTITSGMSPGYSRVLSEADSTDVEPAFYRSGPHQIELLAGTVAKLLRNFRPDEIVILSTRSDSQSCAKQMADAGGSIRMAGFRDAGSEAGVVRYSSVHAFKGLEAPAVVLTDIENLADEQARALLYVGMSRARVRLHVLMNDGLRPQYNAILDAGLKAALRSTQE